MKVVCSTTFNINVFCSELSYFVEQLDDTLHNGDVYSYQLYKGCLRMDGQTLVNLEIFNNNADVAQAGKCSCII